MTQPCAADLPAESNQVTTDSFLAPGYSGPLFLVLIAIMLMLFHGSVGNIVGRLDTGGGYSHGWLILGLIGWMLWEQRSTVFSGGVRQTLTND